MLKKCSTCGRHSPEVEFHGGPEKKKKGRSRLTCKSCHADRWRVRCADDPSLLLREKARHYGLTVEELLHLLARDVCDLCKRPAEKLQIDHCHETDRVRGALCGSCNRGLGMLGDNEAGLTRALEYVRQ